MYDLKIFDTIEEMGAFLTAHSITDYTFKVFDFEYFGKIKRNVFLSFKR